MRFIDLIGLSLGALRQQKARTLITTLGVVFGAFVLTASLSVGQGVQLTIEREGRRNADLRTVGVSPAWGGADTDVPEDVRQVKGVMSEEKRARLRKMMSDRWLRFNSRRKSLDREALRSLAALDHVAAVTPLFEQQAWASFQGQSEPIQTASATPDSGFHRRRLVAGDFFHAVDERSVVVSEYLCYRFGLLSDADVAGLIGMKLRLEFRPEMQNAGLHVYLSKSDQTGLKHEEQTAVEKIQNQLPLKLDCLDLTPEDRATLQAAIQAPPPRSQEIQVEELTVVGVVRQANEEDYSGGWDRTNSDADVLLPVQTAEEISFKRQAPGEKGAGYVRLLVDRDENVRDVAHQAKAMGLEAEAPLDFIDRQRLLYLLIFSSMTCVAGVALLIAALGIANTMLMSVLERTREIGVFKAVGAGDGSVQLIFLIEGAFIGLMGGGLGLLLAWAASFPADGWIRSMVSHDLKIDLRESLFVFPAWLTVGVVLFAVAVTTLAAIYPARRAARVEPLKALRHE